MKLQIFEVISVVVLKCHVVRILFPGKPNVHIPRRRAADSIYLGKH